MLDTEEKLENLGLEVTFNPPEYGDCFCTLAAQALGIENPEIEEHDSYLNALGKSDKSWFPSFVRCNTTVNEICKSIS